MTDLSITLTVPGEREVVDVNRAVDILYYWKQILDAAPANATVTKVVLTNKSYTAGAAAMINLFLTANAKDVTVLDISDVIAGRPEEEGLAVLKSLCDPFRECNLVEVNLSENAMGSKGIIACESALEAQKGSLQRLYLENMGLASETIRLIADILTSPSVAEGTSVCDNIKVLTCYNNMSGDEGAEAFRLILENCKNLEVLRYSGNRALTDGSKALGMGLDAMGDSISSLQRLDLCGSTFGSGEDKDHGVTYLAGALARAKNLTHANLRDYGLGPEGTELVVNALKEAGAPLVELDLAENEIGPEGAKAVAGLLKQVVGTLEVFKAEENELTSLGVKCIVESLSSESSALKELRLDLNECGHIGSKALCNATLPKLESLYLNENAFPAGDVEQLEGKFGNKLQEMDDNDEDGDVDEHMEEEEDDLGGLADQLSQTQI